MSRADFERLQRELDGCVVEIVELARAAGAEWRALVEAMTQPGRAPTPLPRAADGAANPAEVRAVLIAVQARYATRLQLVEQALDRDDDALVDEVWEFRHRRLDAFVADELAAYIKLVAPKPSIASAFGKRPVAEPERAAAGVQLHRCKTCSAPRRAEALYGNCLYCGHPFFTGRKELEC